MKNYMAAIAAIASLGVVSSSALADSTNSGTINFSGALTDATCEIDINGQGNNATITLPTVSANLLSKAGDFTGRTPFNMDVKNCQSTTTAGIKKVAAYFRPGTQIDTTTGYLKNASGSATNVALRLIDFSGSFNPINVGSSSQVSGNTYFDIDANGAARLPYAIEYIATGTATAGTVASYVVYNLQYK